MVACYAPDATFRDPIFDVAGADVGAMWTMFCERGRDLALEWRDVRADDAGGAAHWEPRYTFSVTGRPVHNVIDSRFTFRDGRIATHADTFDLWRWSRMALGAKARAARLDAVRAEGDPRGGAPELRGVEGAAPSMSAGGPRDRARAHPR